MYVCMSLFFFCAFCCCAPFDLESKNRQQAVCADSQQPPRPSAAPTKHVEATNHPARGPSLPLCELTSC